MIDLFLEDSAIGDALFYTPLMNASICRMNLLDTPANRLIAPLFLGLCELRMCSELPEMTSRKAAKKMRHYSRELLDYYGFQKDSCIPKIKLLPEEIRFARQFLSKFKNPIILRDLCSWGSRSIPPDMAQHIVDNNPDKTFLNFGSSHKNLRKTADESSLKRVVYIDDMPLRAVAACYYCVGRYVGCDTGNYHLMLSVGGSCDVIIPEHGEDSYDYAMHLYPSNAFEGQARRVNYLRRKNMSGHSIVDVRY